MYILYRPDARGLSLFLNRLAARPKNNIQVSPTFEQRDWNGDGDLYHDYAPFAVLLGVLSDEADAMMTENRPKSLNIQLPLGKGLVVWAKNHDEGIVMDSKGTTKLNSQQKSYECLPMGIIVALSKNDINI